MDSTQVKEIFDHKVTALNREAISVFAVDPLDEDGANHAYRIDVQTNDRAKSTHLQFQQGGLAEVGPNGITDQALLAIVLDRLRGFNNGPFKARENSIAITKIEEALLWMGKRATDRAARGVEGSRTV